MPIFKFLGEFLKKVGDIFENLFNQARKTWKKLSPEVQNAMLHGSDNIATINDHVDETPQFILHLLQEKYPDLTLENIHASLKAASEGLSIGEQINDEDLGTMIINLQKYLSGLEGVLWAKISHALALGIAVFLAPAGTKLAAITSLLEYVFQDLIKGKTRKA
jgi:hypothetical protein